MPLDSWLPVGFTTPDGERAKRALFEGADWQLYEAQGSDRILVFKESLANRWFNIGLLDSSQVHLFNFNGLSLGSFSSGIDHELAPIENGKSPSNKSEALSFAEALRATRERDPDSALQDGIYAEKFSRILPTYSLSAREGDDVVFGRWLTGGVPVSVKSFRRLRSLMSWLSASHLRDVVVRGGFEVSEKIIGPKPSAQKISDQSEAAEVAKSDVQKTTQTPPQ